MASKRKRILLLLNMMNQPDKRVSLFTIQRSTQSKFCEVEVNARTKWPPWLSIEARVLPVKRRFRPAVLSKVVDLGGAVTIWMVLDLDIVGLRDRFAWQQWHEIGYRRILCRIDQITGRVPGWAAYTKMDRKDRTKLSSLHRSGNLSYYK